MQVSQISSSVGQITGSTAKKNGIVQCMMIARGDVRFLSPWLEKQKGDIAISQMSGVSVGVGVVVVGVTNLVNAIS